MESTITLKQLICLLAVAEVKHFRKAAEMCGLTQPSLSVQIQNLEAALGVQLVERSRAGVSLTPIGRDVASRAQGIHDGVTGLVDHVKKSRHELLGMIRLGATPTLGPYLMPHVVAALHRDHPGLQLYIREGAAKELDYALSSGTHDIILTQLPLTRSDFQITELFREPLYLVVAQDHPWAKRESVSVRDLAEVEVLTLAKDYTLHDQVRDLCQTFGARVLTDYEGTSLDALRQMVGMNMGVSFLPALYVRSEISGRNEDVVVKRLKGRSISRSIALAWRGTVERPQAYEMIAETMKTVAEKRFTDVFGNG